MRAKRLRMTLSGLLGVATVAALMFSTLVPPASAGTVSTKVVQMADLSSFRAGNIVSDSVFYDSSRMSEQQIQSFLESRVTSCRSGYTCLKDYYDTTRYVSADAVCGAYAGGERERASRIIYKAAIACGINPQVLLVFLQKEQGLVTSTAPSAWAYRAAMGQGCPDTSACDARYYGLFNQVFGAAWQLKRYSNPPGTSNYFTWYAPGKTWNIYWHSPELIGGQWVYRCGSGPVYIENQATAALYYYTPYQPNAAALAAGYGEGDSCSSYGNRNFFNYFSDWFGSTIGFPTSGSIADAWREQGGASGWLGSATANMVYSASFGGGWYQYFRNGIIFVVQGGPTTILRTGSALARLFMDTGGPSGWLGWPIAAEVCGAGGCAVQFQNGTSAWSNRTGAIHQVNGGISEAWNQGGGVNNPIGVPAGPMVPAGGASPGWYQAFDNAYLFFAVGTEPVTLSAQSGITQRYVGLGGPTSPIGWPRASEECEGSRCATSFEFGTSVWSEGVGIVDIPISLEPAWRAQGGLGSWLGGPVAGAIQQSAADGGWSQRFQRGLLFSKAGDAGVALRTESGITARYEASGGVAGPYGWPRGEERCVSGACATEFDSATITWMAGVGVHVVSGSMRGAYESEGGIAGPWGPPTSDSVEVVQNAGVWQDFAGGWIYLKRDAGPVLLRTDSGLAAVYRQDRGPAGSLGWPVAEEVCKEVECSISFDGGTLTWNSITGVIARK